jgi:hypothetical protein
MGLQHKKKAVLTTLWVYSGVKQICVTSVSNIKCEVENTVISKLIQCMTHVKLRNMLHFKVQYNEYIILLA